MNQLLGQRNFWKKFKDGATKLIGTLIPASGVYMAETQKDISDANIQNSQYLQQRREAVQAAQMQLSWVQHQDNLALQRELEQDRQQAMARLAELNHQRSLEIQKFNQEHQEKLEKFRASIQQVILNKNLNFQKWKLEEEKKLQLKIIELRQIYDRELARYNRETSLQAIREQRRQANSPITLVSDDLLESPYRDGTMPLNILLSPPELNYDSFGQKSFGFNIENHLAESIRDFLGRYYPFDGKNRQTQLLDGAWVSKKFRGGAGVKALYSQLKAVPTVILESEVDNNYLNFRVAYWRGDGSEYKYQSILSSFPYSEFLYQSARERAKKWQETKERLLADGETIQEVNRIGGDNEHNLLVLQEEQKRIAQGLELEELEIYKQYKISYKDFKKLHQYLVTFHCVIVSLIADAHYFSPVNNIIPLLPSILPELLKDLVDNETLKTILLDRLISEYNKVYESLEEVMPGIIPELMMNFAVALSTLDNKSYAKQQGEDSVTSWLRLRDIQEYSRSSLLPVVTKDDETYFRSLQKFIENVGDSESLTLMRRLLEDWLLLNELGVVPDAPKINEDYLPDPQVESIPKSERGIDYTKLDQLLAQSSWKEADKETSRLMLVIMGRESQGYLNSDDSSKFPPSELKIIDQLWVKYSNGHFGFSVQKQIWIECGGTPGTYNSYVYKAFAERVGWKRGSQWLAYNNLTFNTTSPPAHLPCLWGSGEMWESESSMKLRRLGFGWLRWMRGRTILLFSKL